MRQKIRFLPVLFFLVSSILACQINVGGPEKPANSIPVSTEAVDNLKENWEQKFEQAQSTGTISLSITESQLTSFLAFQQAQKEDPIIREPQVYLRDGEIQIFGLVEQGFIKATARVVAKVTVDENGEPKLEISSVDFGPIPVPDDLRSALSATLDEAFTGEVGPVATGIRIEDITIADGTMMITGRIR